jgi:hypothetical protein
VSAFREGGTDFRGFYEREEGCGLSSAIDKYIFVIVKERFDDKIRVGYTRTEMVDKLDQVQHDLVREALRRIVEVQGRREHTAGHSGANGVRTWFEPQAQGQTICLGVSHVRSLEVDLAKIQVSDDGQICAS